MLVLVAVMSCPCYLNNFPLELTRCCEANFCFEKLTKPQGEGSAAWAVALQSGRRPTDGSPVSLPEAFGSNRRL